MKELQKSGFSVVIAALVLMAACFATAESPLSTFEAFDAQYNSDVNPESASDTDDEPVVIAGYVVVYSCDHSNNALSVSERFIPQAFKKHSPIRAPPAQV